MNDADVLVTLRKVSDPEIGISIVDLGLVCRAVRTASGIDVALTMTTPSCPLGEMLVQEARDILRREFPEAPSVRVELVWDPPWSPDRMSEIAARKLA